MSGAQPSVEQKATQGNNAGRSSRGNSISPRGRTKITTVSVADLSIAPQLNAIAHPPSSTESSLPSSTTSSQSSSPLATRPNIQAKKEKDLRVEKTEKHDKTEKRKSLSPMKFKWSVLSPRHHNSKTSTAAFSSPNASSKHGKTILRLRSQTTKAPKEVCFSALDFTC